MYNPLETLMIIKLIAIRTGFNLNFALFICFRIGFHVIECIEWIEVLGFGMTMI